jgi:dTDP-4-dehydrorhamnose reductase
MACKNSDATEGASIRIVTSRPRLLITGVSGLLGLNAALQWRETFEVTGCYLSHPVVLPGINTVHLDLEDEAMLLELVRSFRPNFIFHTAGLTNVDRCELDPLLAYRLNVQVTDNVAKAARETGARLLHISTDHLFSGDRAFCDETTEPNPINTYARTKLEAEQVVQRCCPDALIFRTNFIGWGSSVRTSFTDWILTSLDRGTALNMFTDVFITPILINDLLDCIVELLQIDVNGLVNIAGSERVSKYDVGVRTARYLGYSTERIRPISVDVFPFAAARPRDMSLSTDRASTLLARRMPSLDVSLKRLRQLREESWPAAIERAIQAPVSG